MRKNNQLVSFYFNRIVILESLEQGYDTDTATPLFKFLSATFDDLIPIEIVRCAYADEFKAQIQRLVTAAESDGDVPLLHIEMHGDSEHGLEFANGSQLSWPTLAELLLKLNVATSFNLLTVCAACFGAYFMSQLNVIRAAPCYALIAPTVELDPGEVLGGMMRFYGELRRTKDVGIASKKLPSSAGSKTWLGETAERWYERTLYNYARQSSTREALKKRTRIVYRQLRSEGKYRSMGFLKRQWRRLERDLYHRRAFDTYFSTEKVPENRIRFAHAQKRMLNRLDILRKDRNYFL
jgi:hypothetical protein